MSTRVRWIAGIVGATALVALVVAAALWLVVDRDALRRFAVAAVKAQTGWDLVVEEPVGLSLDGGLGVTLRGLRLEGPSGGPLQADALRLRLRPWPLLERRLEVEALTLQGLVVNWRGPQRIDATASVTYDGAAQTLVADPIDGTLDGAPFHGRARWQGGAASALTAELRAEAIVVAGARFDRLVTRTTLKDGSVRQEADAALYGGTGTLVLEGRPGAEALPWSLQATLDDVRLHQLARDLGRPGRLEGRASLEADLRWVGLSETAVRRTLSGKTTLALRDGALRGVDLPYLVRRAGDALDGKASQEQDSGSTALAALDASASITEGVLRNDDLRGDAPPFQLGGRGTVDLAADRLDYLLTTTLPEAAPDVGKKLRALRGVPIPVRLTGPIADPKVALDLEAVLQGAARLRLERRIEQKLDGKLGDKLKGLLGR